MPSNNIYLALGSNLGDREKNLKEAARLLSEKVHIVKSSKAYETDPVGYTDQGKFLNSVLHIETPLSPESLLIFTQEIEHKLGRERSFQYAPRTLDIDILFFNDLILKTKNLEIPHPFLHERLFVLEPFMDLNPAFIHPVLNKSIETLFKDLT
ncbi:MAG: 2-amino-4-hydroxy-6-hydroxymethyldihydropteridine diphosphokinase [Alphaproteobacteria bacterium]